MTTVKAIVLGLALALNACAYPTDGEPGAPGEQGEHGEPGEDGEDGSDGMTAEFDPARLYTVRIDPFIEVTGNGYWGADVTCKDVADMLVSGGCEADTYAGPDGSGFVDPGPIALVVNVPFANTDGFPATGWRCTWRWPYDQAPVHTYVSTTALCYAAE